MEAPKQRLWLVGLGSHMPVVPGDVLDMPGAPEPVRLIGLHGAQARIYTSAGEQMVDLATVGIVPADAPLCRPRPAEGPLDHREHRLSGLSGAPPEGVFYLLWTSFDGLTPAPLPYMTELAGLVAYAACCADPGNRRAQLVHRRPGQPDAVLAAFDRDGLSVPRLKPDWNAAA